MSNDIRALPSLPQFPFLGNILSFRQDRLKFLRDLGSHGDLGVFYLGSYPVVFINSAEYAHGILVQHAQSVEKSLMLRKYMRPLLGNGLLTSENSFHRRQRKLVAPAFQHRHIANYANTISAYTDETQARWHQGQRIDIAQEMMRLTLRVMSQTLFSTDINTEADALGRALTTVLNYSNSVANTLIHIPYHWPIPQHKRVHAAIAQLDTTIQRLIHERRTQPTSTNDLLSVLLQAHDDDDGSFMTDTQVRDELMTLFLAGHETTANALTWTWYLLAHHPHIATKIKDEVDSTVGTRLPTMDDLSKLPYTLQVFKESLRLYPPVYMIARKASQAFELGSYHVPEGMAFVVSPYTIHRRADYFDHPEDFNPDRFDTSHEASIPKNAYIPFSLGPRNCIGNHFAMMEGHLMLAIIAQRMRLLLAPNQRIVPDPSITLRPKGAIHMIVERF
ncbi:cytochrome P450 (plasmid) [Herpetosiphon aurantiacus DSM 785]|uniref:Cytochrome P450 n=1 Tax=Herpetosiphon aurantiacus (strain ATCC 23779 / DSM 785 / 114-95) TaxID=316274 RepID=A9B970_HERA2|nr:cytochrome P450 [Herpetosiphon aurantiacus DSM 785]